MGAFQTETYDAARALKHVNLLNVSHLVVLRCQKKKRHSAEVERE